MLNYDNYTFIVKFVSEITVTEFTIKKIKSETLPKQSGHWLSEIIEARCR